MSLYEAEDPRGHMKEWSITLGDGTEMFSNSREALTLLHGPHSDQKFTLYQWCDALSRYQQVKSR